MSTTGHSGPGGAGAVRDGVAGASSEAIDPSVDPIAPPPSSDAIAGALSGIVGPGHVERDVVLGDASGLSAVAPVVVRPADAAEVADVVAWAYGRGVAIVPVGGRSGYSGGIVPEGDVPQVAVALDRLDRVRSFDPLLWRIEVEAGVTTATVHRLARENGLYFPPDPGAPEQSQIGGNLATNAGGPHAFKHGVTGRWVTGVEAVIAPGELVRFGGPLRKDVAGYDLRSLLIGSEGTLGIITAAWLRLVPAPPTAIPVVAGYASIAEGVQAIEAVLASGVVPATLEYVQGTALSHAPPPFLDAGDTELLVLAEAESEAEREALLEALGPAARVHDAGEVWRWRGGMSLVVRAVRGEKLAEDIAVPLDRLAEAIRGTLDIGERVGLEATSWGHAGDGNIHATFLYDPGDPEQTRRAQAAGTAVFDLARELGGSVSGEHGLGVLKRGQLLGQWSDPAVAAHEAIRRALDPAGLFNPGKKVGRPTPDARRLTAPAAPRRPVAFTASRTGSARAPTETPTTRRTDMTDTTACDLPAAPDTATAAVLVSPVVAAAAVRGGARFIDVRSTGGRERTGGLPEAEIVDRERLEETFAEHEAGRPIVVICGSINGSGPVAEELTHRGFTDVVHVDGGFPAWKAAGLSTTAATAPAT